MFAVFNNVTIFFNYLYLLPLLSFRGMDSRDHFESTLISLRYRALYDNMKKVNILTIKYLKVYFTEFYFWSKSSYLKL